MFQLLHGDCIEQMRAMPDSSVDAIVTDPPYELGFMGKSWDASGIAFNTEVWEQAKRVLKPGGHLLAFSGSRTYHRMACAIEDAGFEIRDQIMWLYGSGFPKSLDVSKAIDNKLGNKGGDRVVSTPQDVNVFQTTIRPISKGTPVADESAKWQGWGTALKPAHEPIVVARKPLVGTVAANVLAYGTGALNIDGTRVGTEDVLSPAGGERVVTNEVYGKGLGVSSGRSAELAGRWPANVIHDGSDEVTAPLGEPSRFFYCAKASKRDRNEGCEGLPLKPGGSNAKGYTADVANGLDRNRLTANHHPTVKPTDLMRYLVRLVTPPNGTVLDPFTGSGSTGKACMLEGFNFIGIEQDADYIEIARARIQWAWDQMVEAAVNPQPDLFDDLADDMEASA